jgi:N-carbamoylputrescine amidase
MAKIRVGIAQIGTKRLDLAGNFARAERLIRKAARKGAQIICTQECMLDGYAFESPAFQANPSAYCVPITHPYCAQFAQLAKILRVHLIIGMSLMESPGIYRNCAIIFTNTGDIGGVFYKVHSTYGNLEARFYKHGEDFPVFHLNLDGEPVTIGIMICYDRQMPESARLLAIRGAEIIFNPSATGNFRRSWNTHLIQTRAYENKCFVVSVNHAAPRINGHSFITSPSGKVIVRCGRFESAKVVVLDLDPVRRQRKDLMTRRPTVYAGLTEPSVPPKDP